MKRCGGCFRLEEKKMFRGGFGNYSKKPRRNDNIKCAAIGKIENPAHHTKACECYYPRWKWNLVIWYNWHFKYSLRELIRKYIRVPMGGFRKPVPLKWVDGISCDGSQILKNNDPKCPRCSEMPYSFQQCVFCGQKFERVTTNE